MMVGKLVEQSRMARILARIDDKRFAAIARIAQGPHLRSADEPQARFDAIESWRCPREGLFFALNIDWAIYFYPFHCRMAAYFQDGMGRGMKGDGIHDPEILNALYPRHGPQRCQYRRLSSRCFGLQGGDELVTAGFQTSLAAAEISFQCWHVHAVG